jgi:nucleoside-diphosphate-sugar epimerase
VKALVTGASGDLGFSIAMELRKQGLEVWGLTVNPQKKASLERGEVTAVVGNLTDSSLCRDIVQQVDLIVHTDGYDLSGPPQAQQDGLEHWLECTRHSSKKPNFLFTSSIWVLGVSHNKALTEMTPPNPIDHVSWIPELEQIVLTSPHVNGSVIRPGIVYGRSGGLTGRWFHGAHNGGLVRIPGDGRNHLAMVHIDDLAHGYFLAARTELSGQIYHFVDSSQSSVMELAGAAACAAGNIDQLEFIPLDQARSQLGPLAEGLTLNQVVSSQSTRQLLGWKPTREGFVSEVEVYFKAWRAHQQLKNG